MMILPHCSIDGCRESAQYVAAQSSDGGRTGAWRLVCHAHAHGWNDGGDWLAPIYRINTLADLGERLGLTK